MTTRQTIPIDERNPVDHLNSGYEGTNVSTDFHIPSCGIEDVDMAVHSLFNQEMGFQTRTVEVEGTTEPIEVKKPFVIFATGERFALVKKLRPIRDRNNALILPAISIRRTSIAQTQEDMTTRGMNQATGDLVIKRKLDSSDRNYQAFVNKLALQNSDLPETRRETGAFGPGVNLGTEEGGLLEPHLGNNIFEILTIPQPQFWTLSYEVVFWTNYTWHMNYLIETLHSSFLPQIKGFKLLTEKKYWFISYVDDEVASNENVDDFTEQDRILKYSFTMKVKAFLLAPNGPGNKVAIRRYLSAPTISFDIVTPTGQVTNQSQHPDRETDSKFVLSDIEQDENQKQEPTTIQKVIVSKEVINPQTGRKEMRSVRILETNQKSGETVYYANKATSLEDFIATLK